MIRAVGEEQVVQIFRPVGEQRALAQKLVVLPAATGVLTGADVAHGALEQLPVVQNGNHAFADSQHKQHQHQRIYQQIEHRAPAAGRETEHIQHDRDSPLCILE